MIKKLLITITLVSWATAATAGDAREIRLRDGGIIRGEIQALDGDRYTINSDSLGKIQLERSEIRAIVAPGSASGQQDTGNGHGGAASPGEISTLAQQMLNDRGTMTLIHSLRDNPQIQAILNDPELMRAIGRGDLETLKADPRIRALLENRTVRQITSKTLSR